ncbi:MAG: hypothetical protein IAE91_00685 [Ignavibacteriaceae bacterium]|nr:hypothetical protein [Ignavibacteriaceae bacterium]
MTAKFNKNYEPDKEKKFCLECETELAGFDFKSTRYTKESILKRFNGCLNKGKINGELCSRLFIFNDDFELEKDENEED